MRLEGHESALRMPPIDAEIRNARGRLYRFVRKRIGHEAEAEDLVQDVFQRLAATHGVTEPIEDLTAWLFAVARNGVIDRYRKRRSTSAPRAASGERDGRGQEGVLFNRADSPERAYWRSTVWAELSDALAELPAAQRDVFLAREVLTQIIHLGAGHPSGFVAFQLP